MEDGSSVLKFHFFLILSVHMASAETHSLRYIYTSVTPEIHSPEFIAVALVDGEQFMCYDSNTRRMTPKTEWTQKINSSDPGYCNKATELMRDQQDRLRNMFNLIHTEGGHVLQLMYSCQREVSTTASDMKFGYDGEDFFHLDLKSETWTTDKHQAEMVIKNWDPKERQAKKWKDFLEIDCIDWLDKFVSYGSETLERKVRPEVSLFQSHLSPEVVCHATGFFPKALNITWQKNGENVSEDMELSEMLPNHDGSFQKRSVLKVSAKELQKHKYTCVIQHSSLEEDLVLSVSERRILRDEGSIGSLDGGPGGGPGGGLGGESDAAPTGIIVGVVVALIALIVVVAGIVFWRRHDYRAPPRKEDLDL